MHHKPEAEDVENALIGYDKEYEHHAALEQAVKSNQDAVELATRLYTSGQGDLLNVPTVQRNLYASQDSLVQSDRTLATDLISLYKALGGGREGLQ